VEDPREAGPEKELIDERMEAFRFFELSGKREKGDRFLQPWLYCHVFAAGTRGRSERKRASKELKRFFSQKDLTEVLQDAGDESQALLELHLFDSAAKYLTICRDDDGFGRKLFGLMRMKAKEKENKIISDVYLAMIPLLAALSDLPQGPAMIRALDQACRKLYPQRLADMEVAAESLKDDTARALIPPFDAYEPQEDGESTHER